MAKSAPSGPVIVLAIIIGTIFYFANWIYQNPLNIIYVILALAVIIALIRIYSSPFHYPYFRHTFDVSGKRKPNIEKLIDEYLIEKRFDEIKLHEQNIQKWKSQCIEMIEQSRFQKIRQRQYDECLDDAHCYQFELIRQKTRYQQRNYVKQSYKVNVTDSSYSCNYYYLHSRYSKLYTINFEAPLVDYAAKEQRNLMTKELRDKIARRDNYTCQICGKYMPDGVGLHIDHIVPISKGGKSVPSNLQVLCSKCNMSKSNK